MNLAVHKQKILMQVIYLYIKKFLQISFLNKKKESYFEKAEQYATLLGDKDALRQVEL
jgi:hypothetical protein